MKQKPGRYFPILGSIIFALLNFYSAHLYPGGTRSDPFSRGYDHFNNFWCDLLDPVAYGGVVNQGRPSALAATLILPLSLIPFWFYLPVIFKNQSRKNLMIRVAGILSMLVALMMPLMHDLALNVSSGLLFVATGLAFIGLLQSREWKLVGAGILAGGFSLANYLMWQTQYRLEWMPLVQKSAIASSLVWVVLVNRRYVEVLKTQK